LFLAPEVQQAELNPETLAGIRREIAKLKHAADQHIRSQYQSYYDHVGARRDADIAVLMDDLERFDRGTEEQIQQRLSAIRGEQLALIEESSVKGQRTRLENQLKIHRHRMQERRTEVEKMRLGVFPAPELLNMVVVVPA
jgi:hypothetical protein